MTGPITFLIASPRSGTTWLQTALNAHPGVVCVEQRAFGLHTDLVRDDGADRPRLRVTLDRYVETLLGHLAPGVNAAAPGDDRDRLVAELSETIIRHVRGWSDAPTVVDKITPYEGTAELVVDRVRTLFAGAPIAHLVRDGRDVAVSGVMHWLTKSLDDARGSSEHDRRRRWLVDNDREQRLDRLFLPGEIEQWARTWREPSVALRPLVERGAATLVRYESMLAEPAAELHRLLAHYGVESLAGDIEACVKASSFERMSGGRSRGEDRPGAHVRKGIAGDWRNWFTRADGQRFDAIAGDVLGWLGYEKRDRWWEQLPERLGDPAACAQGVCR